MRVLLPAAAALAVQLAVPAAVALTLPREGWWLVARFAAGPVSLALAAVPLWLAARAARRRVEAAGREMPTV